MISNDIDSFLRIYHKELRTSLELYGLNAEDFSLDVLNKEFYERCGQGFYWGLINAWVQ